MKKFEELVKNIFNYTHEYAINNLPLNYNIPTSQWTKETQYQFMEYTHFGFRKAQDIILHEMLEIEKTLKVLKQDLKNHRRERNKDKIE